MILIPATQKLPPGLFTQDVHFHTHDVGPLPSFQIVISPDDVNRWKSIVDDDEKYAGREDGEDGAPPSILYYPSQSLIARNLHSGGGFARFSAEFLAPLPVGVPIDIEGDLVDKFSRRGRGYIRWEMRALSQGKLLQRSWKNWSFRLPPEEAARWQERQSDDRPSFDEPALEIIDPIRLTMNIERMIAFEGPGEVNSHTDYDAAKEAGFPAPLAQGCISFCLLSRMLHRRFGPSYSSGGGLDVRFVQPVFAGQSVTAKGEVVAITDGVAHCRVIVEREDGQVVAVGSATAQSAG